MGRIQVRQAGWNCSPLGCALAVSLLLWSTSDTSAASIGTSFSGFWGSKDKATFHFPGSETEPGNGFAKVTSHRTLQNQKTIPMELVWKNGQPSTLILHPASSERQSVELSALETCHGTMSVGHLPSSPTAAIGFWPNREFKSHPWNPNPPRRHPLVPDLKYDLRVWSTEDELPSNQVRSMLQSFSGDMWIASDAGLTRFDGLEVLALDQFSTPPLPDESVTSILEDPAGPIWVGTESAGLLVLNQSEIAPHAANPSLKPGPVQFLTRALFKPVWFTVAQRWLYRVSNEGELFEWDWSQHAPTSDSEFAITDLHGLSDGSIAIGTTHGLQVFDPNSNSVEWVPPVMNRIVAIESGDGYNVWIATDKQLFLYETERGILQETELPMRTSADPILTLDMDSMSRLVVATENHVLMLAHQTWYAYPLNDHQISKVQQTLTDREGNLWLAANGSGIVRIRPKPIRYYPTNHALPEGMPLSVATGANRQWIATSAGLLRKVGPSFDRQDLPRWQGVIMRPTAIDTSPKSPGTLWAGLTPAGDTNGSPASRLGAIGFLTDGEWTLAPVPAKQIRTIEADSPYGVALGTDAGLFTFKNQSLLKWNVKNTGIDLASTRCIAKAHGQGLWLGTDHNGLLHVWPEGTTVQIAEQPSIASRRIHCLLAENDGSLWVGGNAGLAWVRDKQVHDFADLFENQPIFQMMADDSGNLWLAGSKGLYAIEKSRLHRMAAGESFHGGPLHFGRSDGLATIGFQRMAFPGICRSSDGSLLLAHEKGISEWMPSDVLGPQESPSVLLKAFSWGTKTFWTEDVLQSQQDKVPHLEIPPYAHTGLTLQFRAASFSAPEETRFYCRLKGSFDEWLDLKSLNQYPLPKLPPGDYVLEVRGANQNQVITSNPAKISFTLRPHLYQRRSFQIASVMFLLSLVYFAHRTVLRTRIRLNELEKKVSVNEERARIARDMHDEVGSDLAQVRLLGELANLDPTVSEQTQSLLKKISRLASGSSGSLREIIWTLNPERDSVGDLTKYLHKKIEEIFLNTSIQPHIEILTEDRPSANGHQLSSEFKRDILRITKAICSNVILHSKASQFRFLLRLKEARLLLDAADDGQGFDPNTTGDECHGVQGIFDRVNQLGGNVDLHSDPKTGTRYRIELEVRQAPSS